VNTGQFVMNVTNFTYVHQVFTRTQRVVMLDILNTGNDDSIEYPLTFPASLRPDVGGTYETSFTFFLNNAGDSCPYTQKATTSIVCTLPPDLSGVGAFITATIDRASPAVILLDASAATDSDSPRLTYYWEIIYPSPANQTNPAYSDNFTNYNIPSFLSGATTAHASFQPFTADIDYVFRLHVSDGCTDVTKYVTVHVSCSVPIVTKNTTLVAVFDGSVPVTAMNLGYDYSNELKDVLPWPNCQAYSWSLIQYSPTLSDEALSQVGGSSTAFVKTAGFGGVIAAIIIVGVTVPVVLYLYFAKKACFKSTDSRV